MGVLCIEVTKNASSSVDIQRRVITRGGGKVRGARCEVVKCEVPVRGINARRWVICEAGMCEAQRTTGAAGVVVGCEPLKHT